MNANSSNSGALRLADWGVIRAQGADATSFLQGQLTQDVAKLPIGLARLAGYCSPKGRLMASFMLWRVDAETIELACSADLLAPTLKRLAMFVMRAKCKLTDVSAELGLWGLAGDAASAWVDSAADSTGMALAPWSVATVGTSRVIRLPDAAQQPRYLLAQATDMPAPAMPALSPEAWAWLEVQSAVARITAATAEQFVPQMVNLEVVGGVNFQKGCYPGQEIVARSQYRGTLKRRAMVFDCAAPLVPGQEVFHSADPAQPAGQVVLAAPRPDGDWSALVEIKLNTLDDGTLHLGAADGPPLRRTALPYALPADA